MFDDKESSLPMKNLSEIFLSDTRPLKQNFCHFAATYSNSVGRAQAGNRKVAGSMLESGISTLCPWERHLTLISYWGHAVYPSWRPSSANDLHAEPQKGMSCIGVADMRRMPGSYERTNLPQNLNSLLSS